MTLHSTPVWPLLTIVIQLTCAVFLLSHFLNIADTYVSIHSYLKIHFIWPAPHPQQENEVSEEKLQQSTNNKKVKGGFLRSLLCCLGKKKNKNQNTGEFVCGQESPLVYGTPRYLLPPVRHQDMHKKCMVIDLDETLVHSSFKVCSDHYFWC